MNRAVPSPNIAIKTPPSTLSAIAATQRITNYIGHRIKLIENLKQQNKELPNFSEKIYDQALKQIYLIHNQLITGLRKNPKNTLHSLSKKEVANLKKDLKKVDRSVVNIVQAIQIKTLASLVDKADRGQVIQLAKNNKKASNKATKAFNQAKQLMMEAYRRPIDADGLSQVELDKKKELEEGHLARRKGVIGIKGEYRIQVAFSKGKIKEQIQSFLGQSLSEQDRKTIGKSLEINGEKFEITFYPLNSEFDQALKKRGVISQTFEKLLGNKGISSSNRQEAHLVNAAETNLTYKGKTLFRALRHAVISDKFEKNLEIRKKNSQKAAEELIKAALLQEIARQGLTLQEAQERGLTQPIKLHLNSVSIVTPDSVRPLLNRLPLLLKIFGLKKQADEKALLDDQVRALKSFKGTNNFTIDGMEIPVNLKTNSFNFGVNAISKGIRLGFLPIKIRLGLSKQHKYNISAWKRMRKQVISFRKSLPQKKLELEKHLTALKSELPVDTNKVHDLQTRLDSLELASQNIKILAKDIYLMLKDKKAYLQGNNQYEIAAKILLLNYTIEQISAFNCMSGKDRTNILDSMVKAFAIMATRNKGKYHTMEELKTNPQLNKQFKEVFVKLLLEGGGLEITELNTGAKGYKVGPEIRIFGMSLNEYLKAKGLSATT